MFLRHYILKNKRNFFAIILFMIISNGLMVINSFFNIKLTNHAIKGEFSNFIKYLIIVVIIMVLYSVLNYIIKKFQNRSKRQISNKLRADALKRHIKEYDISKKDNENKMISSLTNDVDYVINNALIKKYDKINFILATIFPLIGAGMIHISFIFVFPISTLILFFAMKKINPLIYEKSQRRSQENKIFMVKLSDILKGFETLLSYNSYNEPVVKVMNLSDKIESTKENLSDSIAKSSSIMMILIIISQFLYIVDAGILISKGYITAGSIVGLMSLAQNFYSNFENMINAFISEKSSDPLLNDILKDINLDSVNLDIKFAKDNSIEIKNLNFSYADKKILKNLNLSLTKNDTLLVKGKSGVGK